MALGFGINKAKAADSNSNDTTMEKDTKLQTGDGYQDAERQSDEDASISIGKQIALEADNAIQYRTCSWQKVRSAFPASLHPVA
jgi:hypothetical protein